MRYAIYHVPDPASELARLGARWLGRDLDTAATFAAPVIEGLDAAAWRTLVTEPARYGLHATLKAPFRLAEGCTEAELVEALREFARSVAPVRLPVLSFLNLRGFLALMPAIRNEQVEDLSARAVRAFEPFRAPLTPEEIARRRPGLSDRQAWYLGRWGYPYVLDEASFHITLTGRLPDTDAASLEKALTAFFEPVVGRSLLVDRVALAIEPAPGAPLEVLAAAPLGHPLAYNRRAVRLDAM